MGDLGTPVDVEVCLDGDVGPTLVCSGEEAVSHVDEGSGVVAVGDLFRSHEPVVGEVRHVGAVGRFDGAVVAD